MQFKLLCLLAILHLAAARYTVPKFYSQENGVDKAAKLYQLGAPFQNGFRPMQMYPRYHILPPYLKPMTTTTTTSTTTTPAPTTLPPAINDRLAEFPRDLLEIAKTKLGLKNLEEIPSIGELGELLGTKSTEETIKYVRQLTSTDEGVALMKAYIESSDYTNSAAAAEEEEEEEEADTLNQESEDNNEEANYDEEDAVDEDEEEEDFTTTTAKPQPGFLERMKSYLNIYNLLPQQQQRHEEVVPASPTLPPTTAAPIVSRPRMPWPVQRAPLPYHYPIPLRPVALQKSRNSLGNMSPFAATPPPPPPPHLNTPNMKALRMHIATLSKIVQIPPMELEAFLQQKPKLMQLVHKLGRIPLNRDDSWSAIDGELWAAAKKVLEQDEDMRKLLNGPR